MKHQRIRPLRRILIISALLWVGAESASAQNAAAPWIGSRVRIETGSSKYTGILLGVTSDSVRLEQVRGSIVIPHSVVTGIDVSRGRRSPGLMLLVGVVAGVAYTAVGHPPIPHPGDDSTILLEAVGYSVAFSTVLLLLNREKWQRVQDGR